MMKSIRFFVFTAILIISISLIAASATGQVVISEFMPDPARDWDGDGEYNYRDDEWVELTNTGDDPIDLEGFLLTDGISDHTWRYRYTGVLEPGGVVVVFGSDSRAWEESEGLPQYGLSLNNSGDRISLFQVSDGDTVLIDAVDYGGSVAEDDRSAGIDPLDPSSWKMFDAYNPCGSTCEPPGSGCVPTPGASNTCTTSSASQSWGNIKSIFRG